MRRRVLSGNSFIPTINFPLFPAASTLYPWPEVILTKLSFAGLFHGSDSQQRWTEKIFSPWSLCLGITWSWDPPALIFTAHLALSRTPLCRDVQSHQAAWMPHDFHPVLLNELGFNCSFHSCSITQAQHFVCHSLRAPDRSRRCSQRWNLLQRLYWFLGLFCRNWAW